MKRSILGLLTAGFLAAILGAPAVFASDAKIGFHGIGVQLGAVTPENASTAFLFGGTLDLGSLYKNWLDFGVGVTYWNTDRDAVAGEINDLRVHGDLRWHFFKASGVSPYVLGGVSLHNVGADIPGRPALEDALSGFAAGLDLGFGVASTQGSLGLGIEFRQQFVNDVDNWGILARVGWKKRQIETAR